MAAQVVVRWMQDGSLQSGGIDAIDSARATGTVWVDVFGPDAEVFATLAPAFDLHPLAVEDCLHAQQRPKVEPYDNGPFIVWVEPKVAKGRVTSAEVDVFLGRGYLITSHFEELDGLAAVAQDPSHALEKGPEWLLHAIVDRAVDALLPLIDRVSDDLDALEEKLMTRAMREDLRRLQTVRHRLRAVHRVIGPERDVLRALVREEDFVSSEAYRYLQDVGDHLARADDAVDAARDIGANAMDIYLSTVSNNLNLVMKRLTVVATVFMPGTFIVGLYGMNFQRMPELAWRFGYGWAWMLIIAVTGGMLYWFRRSDWW